jgi:hypothetical protein
MRVRRLIHVVLLTFPIVTLATQAAAQVQEGQNAAGAAALFEEAKKLLENKQYVEACPKFLQSYELDQTKPGALYAHAECLAEAGKIAGAVASYGNYIQIVDGLPPDRRAKHDDRKARAKEQMAALAPDVPELTIVLPSSAPPGTRVVYNGEALAPELLNKPRPVDPGEHRVTGEAPGEPPFEESFALRKGEKRTVTINVRRTPPPAPTSVRAPPPPPAKPNGGQGSDFGRAGAYVGFGVGAVGLVFGAVTGAIVISRKGTVDNECPEDYGGGKRGCNEVGLTAAASGQALGMVSSMAFGLGLAGAAAGTIFRLTLVDNEGDRPFSSWRAGGYGLIGAGGAGLVLGAITGAMVLGRNGDIDMGCEDARAGESFRECYGDNAFKAAKGAQSLGAVSTAAFTAGAVGLAAGAGLLLLEPSATEPSTASRRWIAIRPTSLSLDRMEVGVEGRW